jgi:ribosomal protein L7/L12
VSQKEADRQAGQALASLLDETGRSEVEALAARGDRIRAIRRIRELTGLRLLDSRRIFDSLRR